VEQALACNGDFSPRNTPDGFLPVPNIRLSNRLQIRRHSLGPSFAPTSPGMLDPLTNGLGRYMDLLSARQKLVASNIANADTPGYKTQDIDFQFEFMSLVKGQTPQAIHPDGMIEKPDGNDVSMDREARLLAENAIRFNLASTLIRGQFKSIRDAIEEGKSS
jgi:flagellar basal-body rod protein FlgB